MFDNIKRKHAIGIALALMLVLAGCAGTQSNEGSKELQKDTGEDLSKVNVGGSAIFEMKITEKNQMGLVKAQPPETMERSLERQNLKNRYEYLNDQNNMHYVYLMSHGKVVTYFEAQGKVSSVNSKLTNDKQVIKIPGCDPYEGNGECYRTVESPQMDGSYGTNGAAIFFFTTDGKYVQWNGEYVVSEQPLNIQTPLALTQEVEENGGTVADSEPANETETNSTEGGH